MKQFFAMAVLAVAGAMMTTSCAKDAEETRMDGANAQETRTYGGKTPLVMVYVETNDVNPLNALCYEMSGTKFIDILNLNATNIHKDGDDYPTVYLNDKLTRVLEPDPTAPTTTGYHKYVKPLQAAGIKVCMTSLGDWQGIGVANLTAAKADRFADILVYCVDRYGLDGINFDDEYANYPSTLSGSYSHVIKALRAKLDQKFGTGENRKLVTVFQWGNYSQIDEEAGAMIDWADHGTFGPNVFLTPSSISGMTNARWMPQAIQLGQNYIQYFLNQITTRSSQAASGNYGGIMLFNMRRANDVNPLPVFQAIANGAYDGATVTNICTSPYVQDWEFISGGFEITKGDVPQYAPQYTGN